jgi:hypothetical protein
MSIKYFTGSNASSYAVKTRTGSLDYPTSRLGATALTYFWFPETEPADNADGIDAKGQGKGSKWDRVSAKIHSTTAQNHTKTRAAACIGKYNLGRLVKYRKTMKKLASAAGFTAGGAKGERNMFSNKGNGNTGDTAKTKNNQCLPLADSYELYPIDAGK